MLKTVALLATGPIEARSDQSESEEDVRAYSGALDAASYIEELKGAFAFSDKGLLIQGMRFAAHTLRLAVRDALKSTAGSYNVEKARKVVKKMRL